MQTLRAIGILAVFLFSAFAGTPYQSWAVKHKWKSRKSFPNRFHRFLCRLFGLRVTVIGEPVRDRGVLIVANHTSYLDILIFSSVLPVSFIAKSEVQTWPFFGLMARLQESVFIDRSRRSQTGEARDLIRDRLRLGDALVLFPEGTSNDGNHVLAFKSALMGAVEAEIGQDAQGHIQHVPVQPVSVSYVGFYGMPMGRENRPLFAWYGDMELVPHLWECVQAGPVDVIIEFHPPMTVDSAGGRKLLAAKAEAVVRAGQARALAGLAPRRLPAPAAETHAEVAA